MESQECEIIEKLRSEEKTLAEKKADKLIKEKKQKKFGGKKDKSKTEGESSELNGDASSITTEVTVNHDTPNTQQSTTRNIPMSGRSSLNEDENDTEAVLSAEPQTMVSEHKNECEDVSKNASGTSDEAGESLGRSKKLKSGEKMVREGTVQIDFIDLNEELNKLMQFPSFDKPSTQIFGNSQANTVDSIKSQASEVHLLDESLFTSPAKEDNSSECIESKSSGKTFIVSDHEKINKQHKRCDDNSQKFVLEAASHLEKKDLSGSQDSWPNRECNGMENSDEVIEMRSEIPSADDTIGENKIEYVDAKTEEKKSGAEDAFKKGEENKSSFIGAVAEANLSVDVDVTSSMTHQRGLECIKENSREESTSERANISASSFAESKLDAVLDKRRIQWMSDCIPWSKIKSVQKQGQVGGKQRLPM